MALTKNEPASGFTIPSWALAVIVSIITNLVLFAFYQGKNDNRLAALEKGQTKLESRMDNYDAHKDQLLAQYELEYKQKTKDEVEQMQQVVTRLLELQQTSAKK